MISDHFDRIWDFIDSVPSISCKNAMVTKHFEAKFKT